MTVMMHGDTNMPPCHYMRHVAMPLMAACTILACPLWLCASCCLAPYGYAHYVTLPLVAVCTMSPCPSWLCILCHCAHITMLLAPAYPLLVCFLFSFSANFFFCSPVTVLSPSSLLMDIWPSSPFRAYHGATINCDDNATITMAVAVAPAA